jgi:hypothetical protein
MSEYQPENQEANLLPEWWVDPTKGYNNQGVTLPYLRESKIPPAIKDAVAPWLEQARKRAFEPYRKDMREVFRKLARPHPAQPVDVLIGWANATPCGVPAVAMLSLWLTELLALKNPRDDSPTLEGRAKNALSDLPKIWDKSFLIARELWPGRSAQQNQERLVCWLADHVAAQIWGCFWVHQRIYPQTGRSEPTATERRNRDVMKAWGNDAEAREASRGAELEGILGERARQLPAYNPDHPVAHAVKLGIQNPKLPSPGAKSFFLVITLLPLVIHHNWLLVDIVRCMEITCPKLAGHSRLNDFIARSIMAPMGLKDLINPARRRSKNFRPPALGSGYLTAFQYLNAPF